LLKRIRSIKAIDTIGPNNTILKLNELLVTAGGVVHAQKYSSPQHREVGESFDLVDK
jgi:hypothetical protein